MNRVHKMYELLEILRYTLKSLFTVLAPVHSVTVKVSSEVITCYCCNCDICLVDTVTVAISLYNGCIISPTGNLSSTSTWMADLLHTNHGIHTTLSHTTYIVASN